MGTNRAIDDLMTAHLYLTSAIEPVLPALPELYATEKGVLDAVYAEIVAATKSRTCVGVQRTTNLQQRKAWAKRADVLIAKARLFLRATAPDTLREYFPEPTANASRKIDRLHAITKALTVSEHFGHAHLGAFKAELEALQAEGEPIFGAASASVTEQKTEVEKLTELKAKWEDQYQKLKLLIRGYFHSSSTDWAKFFDEKRQAKAVQGKDGAEPNAPEAAPVELAS
jgi:hypothetical protein